MTTSALKTLVYWVNVGIDPYNCVVYDSALNDNLAVQPEEDVATVRLLYRKKESKGICKNQLLLYG